jgi:exosortase
MAVTKASTSAPPQFSAKSESQTGAVGLIAGGLFLAAVWAEVIHHLQVEWSNNPQYRYAWSVPFLALYLFWKRWVERPLPTRTVDAPVAALVLIAGAVALFPLRFVAEANPDWRLLSWTMTAVAVAVTLAFVYAIGGKSWLRHFAFPVLFVFVAVPWPVQIEQAIIQNLMRAVTEINVFFLSVAGIPALQHGNVIEVRSGFIGIEEACSGVRSLQATLMVSLFLGEFYSFSALRRLALIIAGALLAFICNLVRTAILVWVGAQRGADAIEAWHDPAGLTILLVCLFGLWGLSLLMSRSAPQPPTFEALAEGRANALPATLLLALTSWMLIAEFAVQGWYRIHQSDIATSRWHAQWPKGEDTYKAVTIPPATQAILRYDDGGGATWNGPDLRHWMMYFFRWLPGRTAALFVKVHRPDVCLPASGLNLTRDDGIQLITVNGIKLPVRSYRFEDHGVPLHVMYCYWDARSSYETVNAAIEEDWTARGRLRAALKGRREIGAQMLELVVWGYEDDVEAKLALERELARVIQSE